MKKEKLKMSDICSGPLKAVILNPNDPEIKRLIQETNAAQERILKLKIIDIEKIKNTHITI